jgi:hypothetical protein
MYRLTWRSVMCLPDNQGSPAIAGGTLIETTQAAHLTGDPNCRHGRIASSEMLSDIELLPHLICSPPVGGGSDVDEAGQHSSAR